MEQPVRLRYAEHLVKKRNPSKSEINKVLKDEAPVIRGKHGIYVLLKYLGGGTYGDVFLVRLENDPVSLRRRFAMKISLLTPEATAEIEAYHRLQECAAYVICVSEVFKLTAFATDWAVIVQELLDNDLLSHFPRERDISNILLDLLMGIYCMHANRIVHMDIKLANVFVITRGRKIYKIGDPGLACTEQSVSGRYGTIRYCQVVGTYIPPDIANTKRVGEKLTFREAMSVDIWGAGVLIYIILVRLGYYPRDVAYLLNSANVGAIHNNVYKPGQIPLGFVVPTTLPTPKPNLGKITPEVIEQVLARMLSYNTADRPLAGELLRFIVRQMNWEPVGREEDYLHKIKRTTPCEEQLRLEPSRLRRGSPQGERHL